MSFWRPQRNSLYSKCIHFVHVELCSLDKCFTGDIHIILSKVSYYARCGIKLKQESPLPPYSSHPNTSSESLIPGFGKRQLPADCSLLPRRTNAIFISVLQLAKLPPGTSGYFSPPLERLNTMSFMPPGENRRSGAWSVHPIMLRICSIFCAWSVLFLTEVCAQSQRRYLFTFIYNW